jgi:hypothetical protein
MIKPPTVLFAVLVALIALFLCDQDGFARIGGNLSGRLAAKYDDLRGHVELMVCDLGDCTGTYFTDDPVERDYANLLLRKYRIKYNITCSSTERPSSALMQGWKSGYAQGYNAISFPAIKRKYGNTALVQAHKQATQNYLTTHPLTEKQRESLETSLRADER